MKYIRKISKKFPIQNLNTTINIEKNSIVKKIDSAIRGGQIYCTSSRIKINGGIIQNTNNKKKYYFIYRT